MRRWLSLGIISVGIFLFSCSNEKIPEEVIGIEQMTDILKDLFIIDGVVQNGRLSLKERAIVRDQLQAGILNKYELEREEFLKSYNFLSGSPQDPWILSIPLLSEISTKRRRIDSTHAIK